MRSFCPDAPASIRTRKQPPMSSPAPPCRTITVLAFRGDRSRTFAATFLNALADQKKRRGPGPTALDSLLFTGHTGVSTNGGTTSYGFNPDGGHVPIWKLMDRLKNGDAFPSVV